MNADSIKTMICAMVNTAANISAPMPIASIVCAANHSVMQMSTSGARKATHISAITPTKRALDFLPSKLGST